MTTFNASGYYDLLSDDLRHTARLKRIEAAARALADEVDEYLNEVETIAAKEGEDDIILEVSDHQKRHQALTAVAEIAIKRALVENQDDREVETHLADAS